MSLPRFLSCLPVNLWVFYLQHSSAFRSLVFEFDRQNLFHANERKSRPLLPRHNPCCWIHQRTMGQEEAGGFDVYLFRFQTIGSLTIGIGRLGIYRTVWKLQTVSGELLELCGRIQRAAKTHSDKLNNQSMALGLTCLVRQSAGDP